MSDLPDAVLVQRSLKEPRTFERVFERHFDRVHAYLRRHVGGDLAEELAAGTFTRAFDGRGRYDAYAGRDAASLDLELADGTSRRLSPVRGWALAVTAYLPDPKALVARRADGSEIERLRVDFGF